MSDNPLGIKGLDHLEFTTNDLYGEITRLFTSFGFEKTHQHSTLSQVAFTQGNIQFLVTADQKAETAWKYFENHGEGVSKISFRVKNAEQALEEAVKRGAQEIQNLKLEESSKGTFKTTQIQGFGDVVNEFVEKNSDEFGAHFNSHNDREFSPLPSKVARIDHLTNNVPYGEMDHWAEFYKNIFGMVETRYFDIKGERTGLHSKVVQLANGSVIIPINEPNEEYGQSQIQEFLDRHQGHGVQHIALVTGNILKTVQEMKKRDIRFLDVPDTYYEDLPNRGFKFKEDIKSLRDLKVLADGDESGYLLQIFSDTYIGPLFFEIIQRKGHKGFGEGNFQALFDAIERDQVKRGVL